MDTTIFKKLGLGDKEMAVYLALLEHGASSVRNLATLTNLNRGTTYDILKKLQDVGLVSFFHKNTKQNFVAEDPERILKLLSDREEDLKKAEEKIKNLIPELKSLQEKGGGKPTTKFYEGRTGVKFILDDVLSSMKNQTDKNYYVYSAAGVREDVYGAYPDFNKKRIKNNVKANTISMSPGGGTYGLDDRKWLKVEKKSEGNMTYILIYADKCAFISRDSHGSPVGVIIENKMIYETQKILFLQMWNLI
ncbi:MAG: helix-turn-helix domain-containing protein [bacterium]|nr:helix-turn-helix domain-containing protein [bacterium]